MPRLIFVGGGLQNFCGVLMIWARLVQIKVRSKKRYLLDHGFRI